MLYKLAASCFGLLAVTLGADALACSPPSDPVGRASFFDQLSGTNWFWAEVVGEESVLTKTTPSEPERQLQGLRVRILESPTVQLPMDKEFTFLKATTGGDCRRNYDTLSIVQYPIGTELQLGTDDLLAVRVLAVGYKQALQCPQDASPPANADVTVEHDLKIARIPRTLPRDYTGCRHVWIAFDDARAPFRKFEATYFVNGEVQWRTSSESLCVYESGRLNKGKSFNPRACG